MPYYKQIPIYTPEGWIDIKGIVEYDPENICSFNKTSGIIL